MILEDDVVLMFRILLFRENSNLQAVNAYMVGIHGDT